MKWLMVEVIKPIAIAAVISWCSYLAVREVAQSVASCHRANKRMTLTERDWQKIEEDRKRMKEELKKSPEGFRQPGASYHTR